MGELDGGVQARPERSERDRALTPSLRSASDRATQARLPAQVSDGQQPHRHTPMSCRTPERSPARPEPSSPQTPGSSGSRSKSRSRILSGGLWRSTGSLVLDEAESGEWCARSEHPNTAAPCRPVRARRARAARPPARPPVRPCARGWCAPPAHWHPPTRRSPLGPPPRACGSGALWRHTGPSHAPLGTAGLFERLFFRLDEEQQVLVYYADDQRLTASRNRPLGMPTPAPVPPGAVHHAL